MSVVQNIIFSSLLLYSISSVIYSNYKYGDTRVRIPFYLIWAVILSLYAVGTYIAHKSLMDKYLENDKDIYREQSEAILYLFNISVSLNFSWSVVYILCEGVLVTYPIALSLISVLVVQCIKTIQFYKTSICWWIFPYIIWMIIGGLILPIYMNHRSSNKLELFRSFTKF